MKLILLQVSRTNSPIPTFLGCFVFLTLMIKLGPWICSNFFSKQFIDYQIACWLIYCLHSFQISFSPWTKLSLYFIYFPPLCSVPPSIFHPHRLTYCSTSSKRECRRDTAILNTCDHEENHFAWVSLGAALSTMKWKKPYNIRYEFQSDFAGIIHSQ